MASNSGRRGPWTQRPILAVGALDGNASGHRTRLSFSERPANAGRQAAQLPWFARNVVIKALIVAHLGRFTRYLGHREPTWPF